MRRFIPLMLCVVLVSCSGKKEEPVIEQKAPPPPAPEAKKVPVPVAEKAAPTRAQNEAAVAKSYKENLENYKDNPDMLVKEALLADRSKRTITILGEATGLKGSEVVEYFLIYKTSGHHYESMACSFALPSDIHEALVFVGMKPGRASDPQAMNFWPKGERVIVTFNVLGEDTVPHRMEELIIDEKRPGDMTPAGFAFTGSMQVPSKENPDETVYLADAEEPNSIISDYNEKQTVLDVPRIAPQKSVYESQVANPELLLQKGALLEIVIKPELPSGETRVRDLEVDVVWTDEAEKNVNNRDTKDPLDHIKYKMTGEEEALAIGDILKKLAALIEDGRDPHVSFKFADEMHLVSAHALSALLSQLEERGIRLEAPREGHLYYKALIPAEEHRKRIGRINQPWELHIETQPTLTATLMEIDQNWKEGSSKPELTITEHPINKPADLKPTLAAQKKGLPVIFVYSTPDLRYGQLMSYIRPVLKDYPIIFVYGPELSKPPAMLRDIPVL
jgi:hypothetical protein